VGLSIPPFFRHELGALLLWQWVGLLGCILVGLAIGLLAASIANRIVEQVVRRTPVPWDDQIARAIHRPAQIWCSLVASGLLANLLGLPEGFHGSLSKLIRAGAIAATIWGLIRALYAVASVVADESFARDTMDPQRLARARSLRTQVIVAVRVLSALLAVVGVAMVALQFSVVRSVGMSLLASAGVAGVVLGFAAQKSLGALLAGIQISLSQPIRIGDSVIVQNEYGVIEDIGLTFVTVKLWDERRLIVPTPRFLEEPFQNWSRTNVGLIGTVFLRIDHTVPMPALRAEFEAMMDKEPLWDGRVKSLAVTDFADRIVEVRCLVSARNAGALWDLRASVREKLLTFVQDLDDGAHLPRTRLELTEIDGAGDNGKSRRATRASIEPATVPSDQQGAQAK
jgi:small-conductance mechanosensitive channel